MIKFENVSKVYKNLTVINKISFEINSGEIVVLIGPSGCGKTTTLKMINRLTKATTGSIKINGEDIFQKDIIKLRRNMGYVIQQTGLFPHMTIKENIEIIPRLEKRDPKKIEARTIELLEMVGLNQEDYLHRYPTQLSGGQQQRVGVARAFATNPEVILMDEPFSALDPITRSQLQDELVTLQSELKKTIVFVTHDMDEAVKIADRICIMNKGEIVQYDTPENILKYPADDFVSEFVGKQRIWSAPDFIKAKDIMITEPVVGNEDITVLRCLEKMRYNKVDSVLIINKKRVLLGIVTAKMLNALIDMKTPVKEVMRKEFVKAQSEDSIIDVLKLVKENNISNIPILDEVGVLQGLITTSSLVTTLSTQFIDTEELL